MRTFLLCLLIALPASARDCLVVTYAKPMQTLYVDELRIYVPVDAASGAPVIRKCPTAAEAARLPLKPVELSAALYGDNSKKPATVRGSILNRTSVAPPMYYPPKQQIKLVPSPTNLPERAEQ